MWASKADIMRSPTWCMSHDGGNVRRIGEISAATPMGSSKRFQTHLDLGCPNQDIFVVPEIQQGLSPVGISISEDELV